MSLSDETFEQWISAYGNALMGENVDAVLKLFSEDVLYRENPFDAPKRGHRELRGALQKQMQSQEDPVFDYEIICVTAGAGWAQWTYRFTREGTDDPVRISGVLKASISADKCSDLQQWQNRLEPGQGDLMRDFDA